MSAAKSAWNRAHDATREDERARALASLHEHIDNLERDAAEAKKTVKSLIAERLAVHERLTTIIDEHFGLHPTTDSVEDALNVLDSLCHMDTVQVRAVLQERDALQAEVRDLRRDLAAAERG